MTSAMYRFVLLTLLLLGTSACFLGDGEAGSCDFRKAANSEPRCQDWTSTLPSAKDSYKLACDSSGGLFSEDSCPRADSVGGCKQVTNNADGSDVIDFYYAPRTTDDVKMTCTDQKEEFVEP